MPTSPDPARPLGRLSRPLNVMAIVAALVALVLAGISASVQGDVGPVVGSLVFFAVIVAVMVPLELMQRSGRGMAAPMGTAESRWSMAAFSSVLALAAGLGAIWALSADRVVLAVALGVFVGLALIGLVAAVVGPAESMRGLRPGEKPRSGSDEQRAAPEQRPPVVPGSG